MSPIYKDAKECYKNNEFSGLRIEKLEDGCAAVYSKSGKFLQLFSSRLIAENEINKQCEKARKFIS
jgi:hypothetical protein